MLLSVYIICKDLIDTIASNRVDGFMFDYLGKVYDYFYEYNELLPSTSTPAQLNTLNFLHVAGLI